MTKRIALASAILAVTLATHVHAANTFTSQIVRGSTQPASLLLTMTGSTTGAGPWVNNPENIGSFALTVVPVTATQWTVNLEGTIDGINPFTILQHTNSNGSASVLQQSIAGAALNDSGSKGIPIARQVRINVVQINTNTDLGNAVTVYAAKP